MNRQYVKLLWLCAQLGLLTACSRGAGNDPLGGIEGSGLQITASGVVTSLGSIVVNGVEYDLAGATITIDDSPATESDLAPGQVTIVEGEISSSGARGAARRVSVEIAVAGPISAVDVGANRLTILGQTIEIHRSTNIENAIVDSPLGGLDVGRDVEVSAFVDSSGVLHAGRIESRKPSTPLLVTGYVSNLDTKAGTFSINGQVVSYATATLTGFESRALATGAPVRVAVAGFDQSALVAADVRLRDLGLPGMPGDAAVVQGWVTRLDSDNGLDVDGHPVVTTANTTINGTIRPVSTVKLDTFVTVRGKLITNSAVQAGDISEAVLPGSLSGDVTIGNSTLSIEGLLTTEGAFRLNIEEWSGGPPVLDSGLGQLVGSFTVTGSEALGTGVLIAEGCGLSPPGRFCGQDAVARIELTKTGSSIDAGSSGLIRVTTDNAEETWPVQMGYWGGRAGFDPPVSLASLYEVHQAEFTHGDSVAMSIVGDELFFESAQTGCTGNGTISPHGNRTADLYDVTLTIEGCRDSFAYLNTYFEGLSTLESLTPWDYDYSTLRMWLSTPDGAAAAAAITLWATSSPP